MGVFVSFLIHLAILNSPVLSQNQIADRLVVYGNGFRFGVKEPQGWLGDTEHASVLSSNIIFYPKGDTITSPYGVIRVRVNDKVDENTAADLAADMDDYKSNFADIQYDDLNVSHPEYKCFPKVFYVEGKFYEYVTYVNPGSGISYILSVSLSTQKLRATPAQLSAYAEIVASLKCARK
jgi:hypothetical protein